MGLSKLTATELGGAQVTSFPAFAEEITAANSDDQFTNPSTVFVGSAGNANVIPWGAPDLVLGTLDYDAQSANFTAGLILTGGTSGATGYIVSDVDNGADGTLTIIVLSGTFQNDETITDSGTGSATSDGTVTATGEMARPVLFSGLVAGQVVPCAVRAVLSVLTTTSAMVRVWNLDEDTV